MPTRCPKCGRLTVDKDPRSGVDRCFANNCSWIKEQTSNISVYEARTYKMSERLSHNSDAMPAP